MQDTFSADFQRLTLANAQVTANGSVTALPTTPRLSTELDSAYVQPSASQSSVSQSSAPVSAIQPTSVQPSSAQTSSVQAITFNEQQTRGLMSDNARGSDKRKQSLYFPEAMLQEIKDEAARLDRSLSWIVQRAWKTARADIRKIPSVNEIDDDSLGGDEP
jgi:uncharacterized small protein (TIGR04563 family)